MGFGQAPFFVFSVRSHKPETLCNNWMTLCNNWSADRDRLLISWSQADTTTASLVLSFPKQGQKLCICLCLFLTLQPLT